MQSEVNARSLSDLKAVAAVSGWALIGSESALRSRTAAALPGCSVFQQRALDDRTADDAEDEVLALTRSDELPLHRPRIACADQGAGRERGLVGGEIVSGTHRGHRAEEHPGEYSMKDHLVQPTPSGIGLPSTAGLLGDRNPGQGR